MADPDVLRSNARAREVAAGLARLATTLIAAIAAKIYFDSDLSLAVLGWIAGAAVLIWLAWLTLSLWNRRRRMVVLPSIADLAPGIMAALLGLAGFAAVKREHGRVMSRRAKRASDAAVETPPRA